GVRHGRHEPVRQDRSACRRPDEHGARGRAVKLALHNYWRSSASHRVRIGLALKGLAYEYVVVNLLKRDQHADAYRARNPMGQVPALEVTEDDGSVRTIVQSLPILEYLDERFPAPPILPK